MKRILVITVLAALVFCPGRVSAQIESNIGGSKSGSSSAAYYYISKPGEITMPINLWGHVRNQAGTRSADINRYRAACFVRRWTVGRGKP